MKNLLTAFIFSLALAMGAQNRNSGLSDFVVTPEFMLGISAEANDFFPERDLQKQFVIGFARKHDHNPQEWTYWLNAPKTGINFGYTDLGNFEKLGAAISVMPFIEFDALGKRRKRMSIMAGMGVSYFNVKYDPVDNFFNQGVTTDLTWSFRASFFYKLLKTQIVDYRLGLVYFHHSNGHTRLPNQGLNSFLVSLSADIKNPYNLSLETKEGKEAPAKSRYDYFSFRLGSGRNVFALAFNDKQGVYTAAAEYGRVYNKTYKLGIGFYYRFYEHYYNYINDNESIVQDGKEFESYRAHPWWNASNLNVYANWEFLLNHVGIDFQIGLNLFKPGYKMDWRINEGWDYPPREIPDNWVFGEYSTKYHLKQLISARMGLKYYLFGTDGVPKHNLFVGAHINANLGQADFTELSLGYVYSFGFRAKT
ncbi:MAG: acyloxyacyl hydrolase [Flavobacteriaceae bacterium]